MKIGKPKMNILKTLLSSEKMITQYKVAKETDMSTSTAGWHLDKLVESGSVIKKVDEDGKNRYAVSSKRTVCYDEMVIVLANGGPVIFGCPFYNSCEHHNCGSEDCLLMEYAPEQIKSLIKGGEVDELEEK